MITKVLNSSRMVITPGCRRRPIRSDPHGRHWRHSTVPPRRCRKPLLVGGGLDRQECPEDVGECFLGVGLCLPSRISGHSSWPLLSRRYRLRRDVVAPGSGKRRAVSHDRGERVCLFTHVGTCAEEVLVGDDDDDARNRPNRAATTPSIGAEISAWKPSRVAGTTRRTSRTASATTTRLMATAATRSKGSTRC